MIVSIFASVPLIHWQTTCQKNKSHLNLSKHLVFGNTSPGTLHDPFQLDCLGVWIVAWLPVVQRLPFHHHLEDHLHLPLTLVSLSPRFQICLHLIFLVLNQIFQQLPANYMRWQLVSLSMSVLTSHLIDSLKISKLEIIFSKKFEDIYPLSSRFHCLVDEFYTVQILETWYALFFLSGNF